MSPANDPEMSDSADEDAGALSSVDESAAEWVVERAVELDMDPDEFLERVLLSLKAADNGENPPEESLAAEIADLDARVDRVETNVTELSEDVRERVIQVKRETDAKAPETHTHEQLRAGIDTVRGEVESLEETVDELDTRLDRGFENYEEILEYLLSETDDLGDDLETVATALVELRETAERVTAREHRRAAADHLKKTAARRGVSRAKCDSCGSKIELGLLSAPTCPSCDATFSGLDAHPGFFRTSILETGRRPALEAPSETPKADSLESILESRAGESESPSGDPIDDLRSEIGDAATEEDV